MTRAGALYIQERPEEYPLDANWPPAAHCLTGRAISNREISKLFRRARRGGYLGSREVGPRPIGRREGDLDVQPGFLADAGSVRNHCQRQVGEGSVAIVRGLAKLHIPRKGLPLNARGAFRAQAGKLDTGREGRLGNSDSLGGCNACFSSAVQPFLLLRLQIYAEAGRRETADVERGGERQAPGAYDLWQRVTCSMAIGEESWAGRGRLGGADGAGAVTGDEAPGGGGAETKLRGRL